MKTTNTKKCKTCFACARLYCKSPCRFRKTEFLYCKVSDALTQAENGCERWKKKKAQYDLSARRFDQAEADIKRLLELLGGEETR